VGQVQKAGIITNGQYILLDGKRSKGDSAKQVQGVESKHHENPEIYDNLVQVFLSCSKKTKRRTVLGASRTNAGVQPLKRNLGPSSLSERVST